jgi:hypothetical protein
MIERELLKECGDVLRKYESNFYPWEHVFDLIDKIDAALSKPEQPTLEECERVGWEGGVPDTPEERARYAVYRNGRASIHSFQVEHTPYEAWLAARALSGDKK